MRARWIVAGIVAGGACFALGVASSRWLSPPPPPAPHAGVSLFPADAGPRIVIDPDSVQLLPDASLRLDLPPGFDAGSD